MEETTRICKTCLENKEISNFEQLFKNGKTYNRRICSKCKNKNDYSSTKLDVKKYEIKKKKNRQQRRNPVLRARFIVSDSKTYDRRFGFDNDLDCDFVKELILRGCAYCKSRDTEIQIGVDRIDNFKGHTRDNVNPCCSRCNFIRRDIPYQAWQKMIPIIETISREGLLDNWTYGFKKHVKRIDD